MKKHLLPSSGSLFKGLIPLAALEYSSPGIVDEALTALMDG